MATNLFQSRPGTVRVLTAPTGSVIGSLFAWDPASSAPGANSPDSDGTVPVIVTKIGYNQSINIQFMPTLKKLVYVYSFGDRLGDIIVSGLAFDTSCFSDDTGWGARSLFDYYMETRAVKENQRVRISLAGQPISGFLVGMSLDLSNTEYRTMNFSLNIKALPQGYLSEVNIPKIF